MNKQEVIDKQALIDELMKIPGVGSNSDALKTIKRFPSYEPQKVKVPKFVAEWIEQAKKERQSLYEAMWNIESSTYYHKYDNATYQWMFEGALHDEHQELFVEAYMHSYEVEEEPRWIVKYIPPFIDDFRYYSMDDEIFDITESSWTSDKEDAYPFTDKEKAEAVALLVDGSVEEA